MKATWPSFQRVVPTISQLQKRGKLLLKTTKAKQTNKRNEREKGNQHEEECVEVRKKVRRGEQEFYDEYQHSKNDHQEVTSEFIQRGV